ncbi:O-Antigen ligase [Rosistilla carotiformis]|uniref:O-Antigen ligase n=1 Tax=Rosistilla carotiformis TaxID=2528017 RepID=A0A518JPH2_9BACT|nr:O-antigen ligase family protein [Rosistilla carotiformis]QDV67445.1 O-Antigen ligase [Rosistilla carotiformis]
MVIGFAVLLSFSRGARASVLIATVLISSVGLRGIGWRSVVGVALISIAGMAAATWFLSQQDSLEKRSEDLSAQRISADDRFEHWAAGSAAAIHYLPLGSGVGTYGFAHLPFKNRDTDSWYRNAHNQYLEVLTESGLLGVAIVLLGILLLARRCWTVFTQSSDPGQMAIGAAGCFVLASIVCQSSVDFVITYPANLLTCGLIFGAVLGCPATAESRKDSSRLAVGGAPYPTTGANGFIWLLLAVAPLQLSQYLLRKEVESDNILSATEIPMETVTPTLDQCNKNQDKLRRLTDAMPDNVAAWQRYAWWQLAELRLKAAKQEAPNQLDKAWQHQTTLHWFSMFANMPSKQHSQSLAALFPSPTDQRLMRDVNHSLQRAVQCNPLSPQSHLALAMLAPISNNAWQHWGTNLAQLAHSNPEHIYAAGLLHYLTDDSEAAIRLWNRYLTVSSQRADTILALAHRRWPPETIVNQLFPDNIALLLAMAGRAQRDPSMREPQSLWTARCIDILQSDESLSDAERAAGRAQLAEQQSDWQQAITYWREAVQGDTSNPTFRVRLSAAHLKLGNEIAAYDQAIVAGSLGARQHQVDSLFHTIERLRRNREPR